MASCESCGREEEAVTKVQRMYLADTPSRDTEAPDAVPEPRTLDASTAPVAGEIELWCASCCATFPHVTVDPD